MSKYRRQVERRAERAAAGIQPTVHNRITYTNWGCRCETCRADWAAYISHRRAARRPEDAAEHGVRSTYLNYGCRCGPCRGAEAEYGHRRNKERGD